MSGGVVEIVVTDRAVLEVIVEGDDPQPATTSAEVEIVIEAPGPQGPIGLQGPPGPPGTDNTDDGFF